MKKLFLMAAIPLFVFVLCLFVQSCQKSEDQPGGTSEESITLTKADIFVASKEYQQYSRELKRYSKKMTSSFSKFTKAQRNEFKQLLTIAQDSEDLAKIQQAYDQMSLLLGFSYQEECLKLIRLMDKTFVDTDFSSYELAKAKARARANKANITKFENNEEDDWAYENCREDCMDNIDECQKPCKDETTPEWELACRERCLSDANSCLIDCYQYL